MNVHLDFAIHYRLRNQFNHESGADLNYDTFLLYCWPLVSCESKNLSSIGDRLAARHGQ